MKSHTIIALACIILLAACSMPTSATQPSTAPTQSIAQTLVAAHTEAAAIVYTQVALQASPTSLPPTAALIPSATAIPSATTVPSAVPLPTKTPLPKATSTRTLIPFTRTPLHTSTPVGLNCSMSSSSPNGTKLSAGNDFDAKWTIKNTGTDTWTKESFDYKYISGQKMQKNNDAYDFKTSVAPGDSIDIIVDMVAPSTSGSYSATWAVVKSSTTVCTMSMSIVVK